MTSLQSKTLSALYNGATDETKMNVIIDLAQDIGWHTFVHHPLIKHKFIDRICGYVDALDENGKLKTGQSSSFKYMLKHSDMSLNEVLAMNDKAFFADMMNYVNPSNWKWYHRMEFEGKNLIIVSKVQSNFEGEQELEFERDIVNGSLDPKLIHRIWHSNNSIVGWNAF